MEPARPDLYRPLRTHGGNNASHDYRTRTRVTAVVPADRTTHEPGEPGVRLRYYLDLKQQPEA
ncbi:DUF6207 family protein [Streptomyces sp. KMM 9044]|nr:DUF6207 family protein [Streptomyces sp. KMM 9044]WAX81734.1 DUF6207 family protein [Streptomyces sp. KMM 9044]